MIIYCYLLLSMFFYFYLWLSIFIYCYLFLSIVIYFYLLLSIVIYCYLLLSIVIYCSMILQDVSIDPRICDLVPPESEHRWSHGKGSECPADGWKLLDKAGRDVSEYRPGTGGYHFF